MIKGLTKKADNGEDMTSLVNVITKYVHIFLLFADLSLIFAFLVKYWMLLSFQAS